MGVAVYFDDQFAFCAVEICDERTYRMLAAKLQTSEPSRAQPLPKDRLNWGQVSAQFSGALSCFGRDAFPFVTHSLNFHLNPHRRGLNPLTLTLSPSWGRGSVQFAHQLLHPSDTNAEIFRLWMVKDDRGGGLLGDQLEGGR